MKKTIMTAGLALVLAAVPAMAQMTGGGQQMMQQQQETPQQQDNPYQMNPGMMGGYGMGPQMMSGYGYGMHPGMMGGYGMGPQMMGGYGYGMNPGMMGGYGMGPQMMGGYGYGMGPQMMGGYSVYPPCGGYQGPSSEAQEKYSKFLDDTRELRRKMHNLMFDYGEAMRSPEPDKQKLQKMEKEMYELRTEIFNQKTKEQKK